MKSPSVPSSPKLSRQSSTKFANKSNHFLLSLPGDPADAAKDDVDLNGERVVYIPDPAKETNIKPEAKNITENADTFTLDQFELPIDMDLIDGAAKHVSEAAPTDLPDESFANAFDRNSAKQENIQINESNISRPQSAKKSVATLEKSKSLTKSNPQTPKKFPWSRNSIKQQSIVNRSGASSAKSSKKVSRKNSVAELKAEQPNSTHKSNSTTDIKLEGNERQSSIIAEPSYSNSNDFQTLKKSESDIVKVDVPLSETTMEHHGKEEVNFNQSATNDIRENSPKDAQTIETVELETNNHSISFFDTEFTDLEIPEDTSKKERPKRGGNERKVPSASSSWSMSTYHSSERFTETNQPSFQSASFKNSEVFTVEQNIIQSSREELLNKVPTSAKNSETDIFPDETPQLQPIPQKKKRRDHWEHRHFLALLPTCNKLLAARWEGHARDLHLQKLKNVKSGIDNSAPKTYSHLELRLKRLQIEEERVYDIKRKNKILLDRIAHQMTNANVKLSELDPSLLPSEISEEYPSYLRNPKRRQDLEQIATENMTILQRLEDKAPVYSRAQALEEREQNLNYLFNIAMYPQTYQRILKELGADPMKRAIAWAKIEQLQGQINSRSKNFESVGKFENCVDRKLKSGSKSASVSSLGGGGGSRSGSERSQTAKVGASRSVCGRQSVKSGMSSARIKSSKLASRASETATAYGLNLNGKKVGLINDESSPAVPKLPVVG